MLILFLLYSLLLFLLDSNSIFVINISLIDTFSFYLKHVNMDVLMVVRTLASCYHYYQQMQPHVDYWIQFQATK